MVSWSERARTDARPSALEGSSGATLARCPYRMSPHAACTGSSGKPGGHPLGDKGPPNNCRSPVVRKTPPVEGKFQVAEESSVGALTGWHQRETHASRVSEVPKGGRQENCGQVITADVAQAVFWASTRPCPNPAIS